MALRVFLLIALSLSGLFGAYAEPQHLPVTRSELLGSWEFNGFLYEGNYYPRPNPNLSVIFQFQANGQHILTYTRKNDASFCERHGTFALEEETLIIQTTWVHPKNDPSCAKDSDMQVGRETRNLVSWRQHENSAWYQPDLGIEMELNNKPLIYLLSRAVSAPAREKSLKKNQDVSPSMGH